MTKLYNFFACIKMSLHSILKKKLQEEHLAVDTLSLEKIWNLYIPLTLK